MNQDEAEMGALLEGARVGVEDEFLPRMMQPILIVGSGRSGTTLMYELLASHPDASWFSNLTNRWPRIPQLAALSRLSTPPWVGRGPRPVEGYRIWDHCLPGLTNPAAPLDARDVTKEHVSRLETVINIHNQFHGRPRFLNKNTRNTRRIPFLEHALDKPIFVHVLRDPRAATASLVRVDFWKTLPVWNQEGLTPKRWVDAGGNEAELAASLWAAEVETARESGMRLPKERYLEVRYEDLVTAPHDVLTHVLGHCLLEPEPVVSGTLRRFKISTDSLKLYERLLTKQDLQRVEDVTAEIASSLGYR